MFDKNRFKAMVVLRGRTLEDVSNALGINKSTLYRKIEERDGDFSREEINKLIDFLHIENPSAIFFADEVANTEQELEE